MQTRLRWNVALLSIALAATTGTTAFAQTSDVTLKVGVIPISDVAPLYLGIAKGYFKDEHLAIEPVPAQGGAVIVPAVLSGDDQRLASDRRRQTHQRLRDGACQRSGQDV
jgi:NitT/TauT family transport system substrate-binding protein